jgi:hypothetical protein
MVTFRIKEMRMIDTMHSGFRGKGYIEYLLAMFASSKYSRTAVIY